MGSQFLHSPDPSTRRLSAVVYAVATWIAGSRLAAWGGLDDFRGGAYVHGGTLILESLLVWFVVAGLGLRADRLRERRRSEPTQTVG